MFTSRNKVTHIRMARLLICGVVNVARLGVKAQRQPHDAFVIASAARKATQ